MKKKSGNIDRRRFLQSSAALGVGLMMADPASGKSSDAGKKKDDIYVALLGAGTQGQVLFNACIKMGPNSGVKFRAVCDIWEKYNLKRVSRMMDAFGRFGHKGTPYTDYREMLTKETDLDAVIIATPDFWHSEHTIASLDAGLHVYCEKEMSNKLEDARKMVEKVKQTGKLLQIGHQRRSNPRYIYCYDNIIGNDMLNRITTINGQWNRSKAACEYKGWPKETDIDQDGLEKYGFDSMKQFRNWRWYKGLGGGPIVDLGSHQIDIYNWFLNARPKAVMASGGSDYWGRQWYDSVMAVYEYETRQGAVRAFYQTITTNSSQGYFEQFMGDEGTLTISEASSRGSIYREANVPEKKWDKWVKQGLIAKAGGTQAAESEGGVPDPRASIPAAEYDLPVQMNKAYHQPHLENFFAAIRGEEKLNCPAEIGYETAVTVLKVNEAVDAGKKLTFDEAQFKA